MLGEDLIKNDELNLVRLQEPFKKKKKKPSAILNAKSDSSSLVIPEACLNYLVLRTGSDPVSPNGLFRDAVGEVSSNKIVVKQNRCHYICL